MSNNVTKMSIFSVSKLFDIASKMFIFSDSKLFDNTSKMSLFKASKFFGTPINHKGKQIIDINISISSLE